MNPQLLAISDCHNHTAAGFSPACGDCRNNLDVVVQTLKFAAEQLRGEANDAKFLQEEAALLRGVDRLEKLSEELQKI